MNFWQSLGPLDLLLVAGLLLLARVLTTALPALRKLAIPPAIVAGVLGMVMGPGVLDVLAIQTGSLETVVYHCLALLYITMALQAAPRGKVRAGARSITFGVPFVIVAQGAIGLLFILGWSLVGAELHPGFGLMLALGFSQGPGQALALGASWEPSGFSHGGQAGLLMAALGFAVCSVVGVALFHIGRARGWHGHGGAGTSEDGDPGGAPPRAAIPGDLDALTAQIALVGAVYLVVWGLLTALTGQLGDEKLVARLWGFHFIFALGVALLARKLLEATGLRDRVVDDQIQTRLSGLIIDAAAVCAIAALRVDLLADLIVPALALALVGGLLTTLFCVWIARRAFPDALAHLLGCSGGRDPHRPRPPPHAGPRAEQRRD